MKTDNRIKALVIAPVAIGFILIVIGIVSQDMSVFKAGIIVLFGGSGIAALITVAITVSSVKRGNSENTDGPAAEGSSDGETQSDGKERSSNTGKKVFSALFVLAFLGCLIGGMVLLSVGHTALGATVFACSFLIIVGAIIISSARARIARSRALETEKYTLRIAVVDSTEVCTTVTVLGTETSRTYRVWLTIDGKQYSAKSRENYFRGDRLKVLLHENGKKVKIVEKASADDIENIESGKRSAVRAAQKKLSDIDKEYRDKTEDELTHGSERLLEMDNVTEADIDELVDRESEIEMEYIRSDGTDEDFDTYAEKRRQLYDEMRRKIMNNPPLDDEPFDDEPFDDEPESGSPFDEPDKTEPESEPEPEPDTPSFDEPTETPSEHIGPETPPDAEKEDVPTEFEAPTEAENGDGGNKELETPSHATAEPVRPTRTKRAAVGYRGIKKK